MRRQGNKIPSASTL
uniref:Uncharacterized protein n=1 Tax=Arundo donax TaxID=35708 RepID=A0A0A9AM47_ARUDO